MADITLYAKGDMFKLLDKFLVVDLIFFSKLNASLMIFAVGYLLLGTSAQVSDVAHGPLVYRFLTCKMQSPILVVCI